jgi:hypothetical protein
MISYTLNIAIIPQKPLKSNLIGRKGFVSKKKTETLIKNSGLFFLVNERFHKESAHKSSVLLGQTIERSG